MKRISRRLCCLIGAALLSTAGTQPAAAAADDFDATLDSLMSIPISSSAKYTQTARDAAATVTLITAEDIRRYGYRTLDEALANVRGFYTSNDRNYSYIGVRGFSRPSDYNNRILLLLNGHSLNENVYGSALTGSEFGVSLENVARIEIVRGPGSVIYGTNAMFAVINVVTEDGNTIDGVRVSAEGGDLGRVGTSVEFGHRAANGLDIAGMASWYDKRGKTVYFKEYDDLTSNHGVSAGRDWDRAEGGAISLAHQGWKLQGLVSRRVKGVPTGSYETDFTSPDAETIEERGFVEAGYTTALTTTTFATFRAYHDRYHYKGVWPYEVDQYDQSYGSWIGAEGNVRWDISPSNRMIVGAEVQTHFDADYKSWDDDTVYYYRNFPFRVAAAFAQDEWQIAKGVTLTAGVRADNHSTSEATYTPRCALLLYPDDQSALKLLYGEAFRVPNVFEREIGNEAQVIRRSGLKPERIRTYEAAWERRLRRYLWTGLSAFHYSIRDLIDQEYDDEAEGWVFRNIGHADAYGVECELGLRNWGPFDGDLGYTWQRAVDAHSGQILTNSPRHLVRLGISMPVTRHLRLSARQLFETRRRTLYDTYTDGFALTNLTLLFRPGAGGSTGPGLWNRVDVRVTVYNLFDTDYSVPGGSEHRQHSIPQDGRNVMMRLSMDL